MKRTRVDPRNQGSTDYSDHALSVKRTHRDVVYTPSKHIFCTSGIYVSGSGNTIGRVRPSSAGEKREALSRRETPQKGKLGKCRVDLKQSWVVSNRLLSSLDRAPLDR